MSVQLNDLTADGADKEALFAPSAVNKLIIR